MEKSQREEIVEFLKARMPVHLIILFGSEAKSVASKDSNLDWAFLAKPSISNMRRWDIAQELAIFLQRDVDLVDLEKASDVFKFQIVSEGEIFFEAGDFNAYLDQI